MNPSPPASIVPLPPPLDNEGVWYGRFCRWLLQPAGRRNLDRAYRDEQQAAKKGTAGNVGQRPGGAWRRAYIAYNWVARAEQFDAATAAAALAELEEARRQERDRCRDLTRRCMTRALELVEDVAFVRANPVATSVFLMRASEMSIKIWGIGLTPEEAQMRDSKMPRALISGVGPMVEVFLDGGDGTPLPASKIPAADKLEPDFHPDAPDEKPGSSGL